jgi:riboflavin kinase / FMN adenylyltransferase
LAQQYSSLEHVNTFSAKTINGLPLTAVQGKSVNLTGAWLAIGSFDGVHRGHQELISQMVAAAHAAGDPAVAITFFPHPIVVLRGLQGPIYLSDPQERADLLGRLGLDAVITLTFDKALANLTALDFMTLLKEKLAFHQLWIGQNFVLGHGREGDVNRLRQLGEQLNYSVHVVTPVTIADQLVSSSQIRTWLAEGNVEQVKEGLGRRYALSGPIVHGDGRGKGLGIPTANIDYWSERVAPSSGVYACWAEVDNQRIPAVASQGYRPTFEPVAKVSRLEAHLLDFHQDLYGRQMRLEFVARLRAELKFPSVESLMVQIYQDIDDARRLLANVP